MNLIPKDIYTRWLDMLQHYSTEKLDREADKLPAISGLARAISRTVNSPYGAEMTDQSVESVRDDEYLAGIWASERAWSLLWVPRHTPESKNVSPERRYISGIPSWSWASFRGSIHYEVLGETGEPTDGYADEIRLLSSSIQVFGRDPFGATAGGFLRIQSEVWEVDSKKLVTITSLSPKLRKSLSTQSIFTGSEDFVLASRIGQAALILTFILIQRS